MVSFCFINNAETNLLLGFHMLAHLVSSISVFRQMI